MPAPVSRDGSHFDPLTCRRAGGYWVGPKGSERKYLRFSDAIAALYLMAKPYWRRRNANGNWGIVAGVAWV